jgi:integrase
MALGAAGLAPAGRRSVVGAPRDYGRIRRGCQAARCLASTAEDYRIRLKVRILPLLGGLPLTAITRDRVRAFIADLAEKGNQRTAILERAVDDGLILRHPAAGLAREINATSSTEAEEVEVFNREELSELLAVTEKEWPDWYPFILTLARVGLRLGEGLASNGGMATSSGGG